MIFFFHVFYSSEKLIIIGSYKFAKLNFRSLLNESKKSYKSESLFLKFDHQSHESQKNSTLICKICNWKLNGSASTFCSFLRFFFNQHLFCGMARNNSHLKNKQNAPV